MHIQNILTINAACIAPGKVQKGPAPTDLLDVPRFAAEYLGLRGMNLPGTMLRGKTRTDLEKLRDRADKAGCPILVLVDDHPLDFLREPTHCGDRLLMFAGAAQSLGCNSVGMTPAGIESVDSIERYGRAIKQSMQRIERMDVNTLLRPMDTILNDPVNFTELIKKVGGFRIGALPSFAYAHNSRDLQGALRRVAPYASASIEATVKTFTRAGTHKEWDLADAISAIRSVGYGNTLCIDYVGTADPVAPIEKAVALFAELLAEKDADDDAGPGPTDGGDQE
ncbi:MAG: hypothetical protein FJ254_08845 [Phycisphaerae bacterium]|nr:hypothetical protein [Phycisphaerae bacterium]